MYVLRKLSVIAANDMGNTDKNPVVKKLIENYIHQKGDYKLSSQEMGQIETTILFVRPENSQFMDFLKKNENNKCEFYYEGAVFAGTSVNGSLGRFYKDVKWYLKWERNEYLVYRGTEKWRDKFDFDINMLPLLKDLWNNTEVKIGQRSQIARVKILISKYGLLGKPYNITSEEIESVQTTSPDKKTAIYGYDE